MDDQDILQKIQALVDEEHRLRGSTTQGSGTSLAGQDEDIDKETLRPNLSRLQQVEAELDQCWDLLRQRRAKANAGASPDDAAVRSVDDVESYRQ